MSLPENNNWIDASSVHDIACERSNQARLPRRLAFHPEKRRTENCVLVFNQSPRRSFLKIFVRARVSNKFSELWWGFSIKTPNKRLHARLNTDTIRISHHKLNFRPSQPSSQPESFAELLRLLISEEFSAVCSRPQSWSRLFALEDSRRILKRFLLFTHCFT